MCEWVILFKVNLLSILLRVSYLKCPHLFSFCSFDWLFSMQLVLSRFPHSLYATCSFALYSSLTLTHYSLNCSIDYESRYLFVRRSVHLFRSHIECSCSLSYFVTRFRFMSPHFLLVGLSQLGLFLLHRWFKIFSYSLCSCKIYSTESWYKIERQKKGRDIKWLIFFFESMSFIHVFGQPRGNFFCSFSEAKGEKKMSTVCG